ncbi:hypothetical protein VPH35_056054 [Triticum aestivum]
MGLVILSHLCKDIYGVHDSPCLTRDFYLLPNASRALAPIYVQLLTSRNVTLDSICATSSTTQSLISLLEISKVLRDCALAKINMVGSVWFNKILWIGSSVNKVLYK